MDVEASNPRDVERLLAKPPDRWMGKPGVTVHVDAPRSITRADVIVDPPLDAWRVDGDGYTLTEPPAPIADRIAREGRKSPVLEALGEWCSDTLRALEAQEPAHPDRSEIDLDR